MLHGTNQKWLSWLEKCHAEQEAKKQNIAAVVCPNSDYQRQPTERSYRKANPYWICPTAHVERYLLSVTASLSGKEEVCVFILMIMFPVTRISESSDNLLLYNLDETVTLKIALQYISCSCLIFSRWQRRCSSMFQCCGAKAGKLMTSSFALLSHCLSSDC